MKSKILMIVVAVAIAGASFYGEMFTENRRINVLRSEISPIFLGTRDSSLPIPAYLERTETEQA